jgi:hypothetical protein
MIAVPACGLGHDRLVLAVQELGFGEGDHAFNHSPTASLATSDDYGQSWECEEPAFTGGIFTTIMFLDFGQSQSQAESFARICPQANGEFGYAFGLDHCWRSSYTQFVQDPDKLHLARFPLHHATELRAWEFFAGGSDAERPQWSKSIRDRKPVLVDKRRIFVGDMAKGGYASPISQGGVVWIEPLRCLVYSSWTEFTFEFYCSPTPWGPWALFGSFHFGEYPWRGPGSAKPWHGGYATSLPSKFLDADGLGGYLQSNWFVRSGESEGNSYRFSLRHIRFSERKHE